MERICPNAWLIQSGNPVLEGCSVMHRATDQWIAEKGEEFWAKPVKNFMETQASRAAMHQYKFS